ncbi:MAG: GNAT family N-acetyltransferase [Myxococcales bacterium]|nr:GNAT family N-acetyltransferase [Myxococcales bacterium]
MMHDCRCCRVEVDQILDLRHRLLRVGLPFEAARFDHDLDESTRHYGAFDGERLVCCLTLLESVWQGRPAWQLRGMATEADRQGGGTGRQLVQFATADVLAVAPERIFWCNARTSAQGFYARLGWTVESDPFDIPHAGPHVRMQWLPAGV